jgi:DNA-binding MarR family transcriptional regulator
MSASVVKPRAKNKPQSATRARVTTRVTRADTDVNSSAQARTHARASASAIALDVAAAPSALAVQSWLSVVRAYNLCTAVLSQRLGALDLHIAEHEVLVNLLRAPQLTQQQLAERCFVAKSGISMLVTRMERAGWVERIASPTDARARLLLLTAKGLALARRAHAIQSEVVNAMTQQFTQDELAFVDESMNQVSQALLAMRQ